VSKYINSFEDVLLDEDFLAWYLGTDETKANNWQKWLKQHPEAEPIVSEAIVYLNDLSIKEKKVPSSQVEAAFRNLEDSLHERKVVHLKQTRISRWLMSGAASVLLMIGGISVWNYITKKTTLGSAYGRISEYKLPDGSQVMLNANSQITLGKEWKEGKSREVWLKGEAFFKIQKTPQKDKFIVHANAMDIIVTGTQFNVVNREDESSILLTEGSVTVATGNNEVHLKPGDYLKIANNLPEKQTGDQKKILAWKQAKLVFDNTSMYEVAKIITRYYGIKVTITDKSVGEKTISGIMPNDNLDVLIDALEATGDFKIEKKEKELIISKP
jgi:ferric-dicitrate binding protein FerR (iron transport regulator)